MRAESESSIADHLPIEVEAGGGRRVLSWATDAADNTMQQATRTARAPVVAGHLALMPDAHLGSGSTIGSVIPTEAAILPAAVGVDLGCGMSAVRTSHNASQLPDDLGGALDAISAAVPAGFNGHPTATKAAEAWLRHHPLPDVKRAPPKAKAKMGAQFGTLGGGNHFIEVSVDEEEHVWVVLHSGSRGAGNILATTHIKEAKATCERERRPLEEKNLAYFVEGDDGFGPYIADMLWAQDYAHGNRQAMMSAVLHALRGSTGLPFTAVDKVDCHHNYAEQEEHSGKTLWITRKGAIRCRPGDRGVIPGSMGDDTYIVRGKGCAASYHSAAHGAGRVMSRTQAKSELAVSDLRAGMRGRAWQEDMADRLLDEAPGAYRQIADVIAAHRDLVDVEHKLTAVLNYKGC